MKKRAIKARFHFKYNAEELLPIVLRSVDQSSPLQRKLFEFAFTSSFRFFLTFNGRLLVVFSLTNLIQNASTSALSFKSSKSTIQRLVIFYMNFCHFSNPSSRRRAGVLSNRKHICMRLVTTDIIQHIFTFCQAFLWAFALILQLYLQVFPEPQFPLPQSYL